MILSMCWRQRFSGHQQPLSRFENYECVTNWFAETNIAAPLVSGSTRHLYRLTATKQAMTNRGGMKTWWHGEVFRITDHRPPLGFPSQIVGNAELWRFRCFQPEQAIDQTTDLPVIRDTIVLIISDFTIMCNLGLAWRGPLKNAIILQRSK